MIFKRSGLKYNLISAKNHKECIDMVKSGQADFLMSYGSNLVAARNEGMVITDTFISSPFALVGRNSNFTDNEIIAIPKVYATVKDYAVRVFPNNKIIIYDNMDDCYNAIMKGQADCTIESLHTAGDVIKSGKYKGLVIIYATSLMDSCSIAAGKDINPIVLDILNKSIASITQEEIENTVYTNSITPEQNITVLQFCDKYKIPIIFSAGVFILLVLLVLSHIIWLQKNSRKILWKMAYIDNLTGISNLSKFKLDAQDMLQNIDKENYSLIRFDIEKFKIINDMFGFEEGDRVLLNIVKAVQKNISDKDLFARIVNDDFIMLMCNQYGDCNEIKDAICKDFYDIHMTANVNYRIDFAIGIYRLKAEDTSINVIFEKATMAHKAAKTRSGTSLVFFNDAIRDYEIRIKKIENTMFEALENGEFVVYVQPKFSLDTLKIGGAESLIRWNHPTYGILPPSEFISLFEKNGFVVNIDNFVLEETCKYQRMLIDNGITPVPISVNQSKLHIKNPNYINELKAIVQKYNIPSYLIELELTETIMHDNIEILIDIVRELSEYGFIISIDDFGSGYSSLNLLKDISANVLKIDRCFLMYSEGNTRGKIILANIIHLAKELNMQTVTEGVETKEQVALLKELGCDMVQGFMYARPFPIENFKDYLIGNNAGK
ncbi:MAG: EAL domain-containing protein [Oscillospiraceae bacterium]